MARSLRSHYGVWLIARSLRSLYGPLVSLA